MFSRNTLLSVSCGNPRSKIPPCLRNCNRKYPPMPSDFQFKEPPLALGILKSRLWYGMDILWNRPILLKVGMHTMIKHTLLNAKHHFTPSCCSCFGMCIIYTCLDIIEMLKNFLCASYLDNYYQGMMHTESFLLQPLWSTEGLMSIWRII